MLISKLQLESMSEIILDQDELEEQRANPVANAKEHIKNKYAHLLNK